MAAGAIAPEGCPSVWGSWGMRRLGVRPRKGLLRLGGPVSVKSTVLRLGPPVLAPPDLIDRRELGLLLSGVCGRWQWMPVEVEGGGVGALSGRP